MSLKEKVWYHSSFFTNQERLIGSDIAAEFLSRVLAQAKRKHLLSREQFTVDGTLIEAWASVKSIKPKDPNDGPPSAGTGGRNRDADFKGKNLKNDTHGSVTDPDAKPYRKGKTKEAKLCYLGHSLMENRRALSSRLLSPSPAARKSATQLWPWLKNSRGQAAESPSVPTKGTTRRHSSRELRSLKITPHIAKNEGNHSTIDGRTTRHRSYNTSQKIRKRVEEGFGWMKTIGRLRKTMYRGVDKIGWQLDLQVAAYNLVRMMNLGLGAT